MAHLPTGSIQTDRIHLLYTATHGRAFFFKIPQAECCPCGARKGRETCPVRRLNQHYFEACYNAADQFGLKPKPHIFIDSQVLIPVLVFERSGGKSPDVTLVMRNHSSNCFFVAARCSQNYRHRDRFYSSGPSKPSFIRYLRNSFSVTSRRLDMVWRTTWSRSLISRSLIPRK